jgi:hypothetical protein
MSQPDTLDLEMDAPSALRAPVAPKAAPAVTQVPVVASPFTTGRALLVAATGLDTLDSAAQSVAKVCVAAGLVDKQHPTRVQLRAVYTAMRAAIVWVRLWAALRGAIEARPALVVRPALAPVETQATGNALIDTLTGIATEGASNASTSGAGSLAGGSMRGVGFADAAGYVRALALGVKAATADSYKQTLRSQYGYTPEQIAGLTVTLLPEGSALPVGPGIKHTPVGVKSVAQMSAAEYKAHRAAPVVTGESETMRSVREAMRGGEIMAVAGAVASGKAYMWNGLGETTRGTLRMVLATANLPESLLPAQSSAIATAGLVLRDENHRGYIAKPERAMPGTRKRAKVVIGANGMPKQYLTRWTVQQPTHGEVGEAAGMIVATATVWTDGSLTVEGDEDIKNRVEGEYNRRRDEEVYEAGQVTAWLQSILVNHFNALLYFGWYVPAKHVAAMDRLYAAIESIWGSWRVPMPMVTCDALRAGLTKGLADEVAAVLADVDKAHQDGLKATPRRMQISPAQAATFLTRLQGLGERASKHVETLGGEYASKVRAGIVAAMTSLEGLCTDGDLRASLLELDALKVD